MKLAIVNMLGRFQDDADDSPGIGIRQLRDREEREFPDRRNTMIRLIECDGPARTLAREVAAWEPDYISVAAYSHGMGHAYVEFSKELAYRRRITNLLLAIDPVPYKWPMLLTALCPTEVPFELPANTGQVIAVRTLNKYGVGDPWGRRIVWPTLVRQYVYGRTIFPPDAAKGCDYYCDPEVTHSTIDNVREPQDLFMSMLHQVVGTERVAA